MKEKKDTKVVEIISDKEKQRINTRINMLVGQVKGIAGMVEDNRNCDDILIQISAIINSLKGLGNKILKDHLAVQLEKDLKENKLETIDELISLIGRLN